MKKPKNKMIKQSLFILTLGFCFSGVAQEKEDPELLKRATYNIDREYITGPYLIYDCVKKHYLCVNVEGQEKCHNRREFSKIKKQAEYACAPLRKFPDIKSCHIKNYEVMESAAFARFCFPK